MSEAPTPTLAAIAAAIAQMREELGQIRETCRHLEVEVGKLRDWRHSLADRFGALSNVPGLLTELTSDLRDIRSHLSAIDVRLARLDGERAAREQVGVWTRWLLPSGWLAAILAAAALFWERHR